MVWVAYKTGLDDSGLCVRMRGVGFEPTDSCETGS